MGVQPLQAAGKKKNKTAPKVTVVEKVLPEEQQRRFDYFYLESVRLRNLGEYAEAFEMLNHARQINPRSAEVLFDLANFMGYLVNDSTSQTLYEQAVELAPENRWYKEVLASYYQTHKQLDKAIGVLEQLTQVAPESSEYQFGLLQMYLRKQDYNKGIEALNNLEKLEGKSEQISMQKFRLYLQLEQKEKAFDEIKALTEEYPNDPRYQVLLGDLYMNNGNQAKAFEVYQQVLKDEPSNVMAQMSLSAYYEETGDSVQSRKLMETLLLNPASDSATKVDVMKKIIRDSELHHKDSTYVLGLFDQLLQQPQENAGVALLSTQYKLSKQMPEPEIVASLKQVVALDPTNGPARLQLLDYAFKRNDYAEAAQLCQESINYFPDELSFYYYQGASLMQLEKNEEALAVFEKGLEQVTEQSDKKLVCTLYGCVGDIYHEQKNSAKSYESYEKALTYNPDDPLVLNNYAYYLSLEKKDLDKAEEMSFRTVKLNPKSYNELDTYAWILFIKGKYTEAVIYIEESLKNGGDKEGNIVEHAGDIYSLSGNMDKALEFWQKADELGCDSKTLKQKIKLKKYVEE